MMSTFNNRNVWLCLIIVCCLFTIAVVLLSENAPFDQIKLTLRIDANQTTAPPDLVQHSKFISLDIGNTSVGIANMFFRMASMYGIGKQLKRNPCLKGQCAVNYYDELKSAFPNLQNHTLLSACPDHVTKNISFAGSLYEWDDVSRLEVYDNESLIEMKDSYLQSHKYFHQFRPEILQLFDFSSIIKANVDQYVRQVFGDSNSTKICAHMRRGDFSETWFQMRPADEAFSVNGLKYLSTNLNLSKLDILLFSNDHEFAENVARQIKDNVQKAHVIQNLSRVEEIALSSRHCDYFLLTNPGSTFGWFMAYLMPDKKQCNVFYNAVIFKKGFEDHAVQFHENEHIPSEWNRMVLDPASNSVTVQNRSIPMINI